MANPSEQAEAEAARRYPGRDTPSANQELHRAGYWAFLAGASWHEHLATAAADE